MTNRYSGSTPGPWRLIRRGVIVGGPVIEFARGNAQTQIAMACVTEDGGEECRDANARLIADGPMLLAQRDRLAAALHKIKAYGGQCLLKAGGRYDEGAHDAFMECAGVAAGVLAEIERDQ